MSPVDTAFFDAFRASYDRLCWSDMQQLYDEIAAEHPSQKQYDPERWAALLAHVLPRNPAILEFGGWTGQLADETLSRAREISRWTNIDIAPSLRSRQVCKDPRYEFVIPPRFLWETEGWDPPADAYDVFLSSHALEHLSDAHALALLDWIAKRSFRHVLLEIPLQEDGQTWDGYYGSHVLRMGWQRLEREISDRGFETWRDRMPVLRDNQLEIGPRWWCRAWR